jgi:hypothetical protein
MFNEVFDSCLRGTFSFGSLEVVSCLFLTVTSLDKSLFLDLNLAVNAGHVSNP